MLVDGGGGGGMLVDGGGGGGGTSVDGGISGGGGAKRSKGESKSLDSVLGGASVEGSCGGFKKGTVTFWRFNVLSNSGTSMGGGMATGRPF